MSKRDVKRRGERHGVAVEGGDLEHLPDGTVVSREPAAAGSARGHRRIDAPVDVGVVGHLVHEHELAGARPVVLVTCDRGRALGRVGGEVAEHGLLRPAQADQDDGTADEGIAPRQRRRRRARAAQDDAGADADRVLAVDAEGAGGEPHDLAPAGQASRAAWIPRWRREGRRATWRPAAWRRPRCAPGCPRGFPGSRWSDAPPAGPRPPPKVPEPARRRRTRRQGEKRTDSAQVHPAARRKMCARAAPRACPEWARSQADPPEAAREPRWVRRRRR